MSWRGIPVAALILAAVALLMLGPAALGAATQDWRSAQVFSQSAGLVGLAAVGVALALRGAPPRSAARAELLTVLFAFAGAPAAAAAPLWMLAPAAGFEPAYFEMVSTFTTTGSTVLRDPGAVPPSVHLWRAATAWFGGFAALTAAAAVFAPRNLGGYEVQIDSRAGPVGRLAGAPVWAGGAGRESSGARLAAAALAVAPVYGALTGLLAILFSSLGAEGLEAVVSAAGVMSTTGLGLQGPATAAPSLPGGVAAEAVAAGFLAVAASRHLFVAGGLPVRLRRFRADPEVELCAIAVGAASAWIFLDHWLLGPGGGGVADALRALWGAAFTCLSFLTTTGYVSVHWPDTVVWSGAQGAGLMLLGLAAMGGGVASTAGGVKLLRSFALYQHGLRELGSLARPNVRSGRGAGGRRVGFAGAVLAWLFVMLFLLGVGAAAVLLTLCGLPFDAALAAAVAAMSNTGAAYVAALGPAAPGFDAMGPAARLVLCATMVLGRVEVLAVVALANPAYWRG
jgi:trk system potassium uptake protein TrkH